MPNLPSLCRVRSQQEDGSQSLVLITLPSNPPAAWHSVKHPFLLNSWRCSHSNDAAVSSSRTVSLTGLVWGLREDAEVLPWVTGVHATCRPQVTICAEPHQDLPLGNGSKPASVLASNSPLFLIVQMQLKQGCSCRSLKERTKSISVCLSFPTACLGASNVRIPGVAPAVPLASECCSRESSQLKILNRSIIPNPKNTKCPFFLDSAEIFSKLWGQNYWLGKQNATKAMTTKWPSNGQIGWRLPGLHVWLDCYWTCIRSATRRSSDI